MNNRVLILLLVVMASFFGCEKNTAANKSVQTYYVGGYTGESASDGKGIYTFQFDPATRKMWGLALWAETPSPSWLSVTDQGVYAVAENGAGAIKLFEAGKQKQVLSSEGGSPCHIAVSANGQFLVVSNYSGGSFSVFKRNPVSGLLSENPGTILHSGRGPNAERQTSPHVHWAGWGPVDNLFYVVDLGLDRILGYRVDDSLAVESVGVVLQLPPGAGPRHMVFHPNGKYAYILNELNNTVVFAEVKASGDLDVLQTLPTLPGDFKKHSQAAHIALSGNGKNLYVSNRGHNSIAHIQLAETGEMTLNQWQSTMGDWPRFFVLLEDSNTLLVANQRSNELVALGVTSEGALHGTKQSLAVAAPTAIAGARGE